MTLRQLSVWLNHIPVIMAREAISASLVASMPYMDEDMRGEVMRSWQGTAGQDVTAGVPERQSFEDFVRSDMRERIV